MQTNFGYKKLNLLDDEHSFQLKLCSILENEPFNHTAYIDRIKTGYYNTGYDPKRFSMKGTRSRIDIYLQTNSQWPHHQTFPNIGIEVKLAKNMGQAVVDAFDQVKKYSEELPCASYFIDGQEVPAPVIYLIVTPDSFYEGYLYKWCPPVTIPYTNKQVKDLESGWIFLTEVYNRLLMKHGAAILREKYFITNNWGLDGNKKWEQRFDLWT